MGTLRLPGTTFVQGAPKSLGLESPGGPLSAANSEASATLAVGSTVAGVSRVTNQIIGAQQTTKAKSQLSFSTGELSKLSNDLSATPSYRADDERLVGLTFNEKDEAGGTREFIGAGEVSNQLYLREVKKLKDTAADNLKDAGTLAKFNDLFDAREAGFRDRNYSNSLVFASKEMQGKLLGAAQTAVDADDLDQALEIIGDTEVFTDAQKTKISNDLKERHDLGQIDEAYFGGDINNMALMINRLNDEDYTGALSSTQRRTAINMLENSIEMATAEQRATLEKNLQRAASNLEIQVKTGQGNDMVVLDAFEKGVIKGPKRSELILWMENDRDERRKKIDGIAVVDSFMNASLPMDPGTKEHRDYVDAYYETIAGDPAKIINLVEKTTILPTQLEQNLAIGARGTSQQQSAAAETYTTLRTRVPLIAQQMESGARERLSAINFMTKNGTPIDKAVELMDAAQALPPEQRDIKRGVYERTMRSGGNKLTGGDGYIETLGEELQDLADEDDAFEVTIFSPTTNTMLPIYDELRWNYFNLTGSHSASKIMAWNDLRSVWGTSAMNKKSLDKMDAPDSNMVMAHPPEQVYPVGIDVLNEDLNGFAKKLGMQREDILIVTDELTGKRRNGQKDWAVMQLNEFNNPVPVIDDQGEAVRWKPDIEKYNKRRMKQANENRPGMVPTKVRQRKVLEQGKVRDKQRKQRMAERTNTRVPNF